MLVPFQTLLDLAKKLRSETGCPWDREQTVASMREHILEEAEEVAEAIEKGNDAELAEEMGDLLFNLIMIAQIASEEGRFDMAKVMEKSAKKLVDRHTWVFGDDKAETPEEALKLWLKNKAKKSKKKS